MSTFEIKSEIYEENNYETTKLNDGSECLLKEMMKNIIVLIR